MKRVKLSIFLKSVPGKALLFCIVSISMASVHAQQRTPARAVIDTLCSPEMYGRGYLHDGQRKAAEYIANAFQEIGVQPLLKDYFQPFQLSINTFPDEQSFVLDGKALVLGSEFIVHPQSGSGKKQVKLVSYDVYMASKRKTKLGVLLSAEQYALAMKDARAAQQIGQGAIVVVQHEKLTASLSQSPTKQPMVNVLTGVVPSGGRLTFDIRTRLEPAYAAQNVIGYVPGTGSPDSILVFCAHYDHLGGMGRIYFPGANDNAAGVAMLLDLARHYAQHPHRYSICFIAFGAEEAGLVGSKHLVYSGDMDLQKIRFVMNLDLVGTGEAGVTVVNGSVYKESFAKLVAINEEAQLVAGIVPRGKAANSDHYYFSEEGVPAFFLYGRGEPGHYHDIYDNGSDLKLERFEQIKALLIRFYE